MFGYEVLPRYTVGRNSTPFAISQSTLYRLCSQNRRSVASLTQPRVSIER